MDSITQFVLGAACGEATLGRKMGNKALLFGAIGGTIPDLDVFVGSWLYNNEIDAMLYHRGFMHSILFSILGAFLFGWLAYKLYNFGKRKGTTTQKDWILLFFWSLFTHPILDMFTPYGTQLFAPFSDYRVAFNNISVADPAYTVPFLLCIIVMLFFKRNTKRRRLWLMMGIGISSAYMVFTIGNKLYMDSVFKTSFKDKNIVYSRFSTQPTILNNILWYGIAETETDYHVAFYSMLDRLDLADTILKIPKRHDLINVDHPDIKALSWFSNGYFNLKEDNGKVSYVDMRYPLLNENDPESFVFEFSLIKKGERWDIIPFQGTPPGDDDLRVFFERIKGK